MDQIITSLQSFIIPDIHFTVLDLILVCVFGFYAIEGYSIGFVQAIFDFLSFVLSFLIALTTYSIIAKPLSSYLSSGFANAIGFFIISVLAQVILGVLERFIVKSFFLSNIQGKVNKWLGILPSLASSYVLLSFILTLIVSLPISPFVKHAISQSEIGSALVVNTSGFEGKLNSIFGGAVKEGLNFLTVEPKTDESVSLHFKTTSYSADSQAEKYMLDLVNKERKKAGVPPLVFDDALGKVGRDHDADMFARGYFSHYTPEGLTPFDRMAKANISFTAAGENLALAPNTDVAMQGLMQSPGHRANILASDFHRVGIGVLDGGIYGEMFAQEFTD